MNAETRDLLHRACQTIGLDHGTVDLIRESENTLCRLPGGVVARIARPGQTQAAAKELRVTRWLTDAGVPAVRPLADLTDPVVIDGRAVTFWYELPPHERSSTADVAGLLRELHSLTPPDSLNLPELAPFVRLADRIESATSLTTEDKSWLVTRLVELQHAYAELPAGMPWRVVHGDAWTGNVALTESGPVLLDFERCALGPPEWDLVSTAVSRVTTGWLDAETWTEYCRSYGYDVTTWEGFDVLRDIRELRMTTMAAQVASTTPAAQDQLDHRIACLRGHNGPRPWSGWHSLP